jgi:hypothetical protein
MQSFSVMLEVLDGLLMLLGFLAGSEGSEVFAASGLGILVARVDTKFS